MSCLAGTAVLTGAPRAPLSIFASSRLTQTLFISLVESLLMRGKLDLPDSSRVVVSPNLLIASRFVLFRFFVRRAAQRIPANEKAAQAHYRAAT